MKTSVRCSLPALIPVTTSWEAFPAPVPPASPSLQRPTHAKVRPGTARLLDFVINYHRYHDNVLDKKREN